LLLLLVKLDMDSFVFVDVGVFGVSPQAEAFPNVCENLPLWRAELGTRSGLRRDSIGLRRL
jgi:hypothetical protein